MRPTEEIANRKLRRHVERLVASMTSDEKSFLDSKPVYRFLAVESWAQDIVDGKLYLSTLENCRKHEDALQGDADEARHRYNIPIAISGTPEFERATQKAGFGGSFGKYCGMYDCIVDETLKDAFVLCCTERYAPGGVGEASGKHCVEISHPALVLDMIKAYLKNVRPDCYRSTVGRIIYRSRHYEGMEPEPGPLGLVKPPDPYEVQQEVRFVFYVGNMNDLEPITLNIPELRFLARRYP